MNTTASSIPAEYAEKLVDPRVYATDELQQVYSWLRANIPLGIAQPEGFDPFWVVTKFSDLQEISRNNIRFPYGNRPSTLMNRASAARSQQMSDSPVALSLIQMDEPQHMKYRILTQAWFSPPNLKKREAEIREIAKKNVAKMADLGTACDFVEAVALNYPLEVIMNILGVSEEHFPFMLRVTQEIFGPLDPETKKTMETMTADQISQLQFATMTEMMEFFDKITQDRLKNPKDDLATVIVHAKIDGESISQNAINGYYMIVATAGHDTTSSSTSAAMWALATQPGLLETLKSNPILIPAFIEEAIRWATPVKTFMRSAAEDVEMRGQTIRKGDWLMLCYASANHDDEFIESPFDFRIDRQPNKHIAFGSGAHLCLGQHLARMEMRVLMEELLPHLKSVKLAGEPSMLESFFSNGLKHLPIEFEMA